MLTRYNVTENRDGMGFSNGLSPCDDGDLVSWDDYLKVVAERDALAEDMTAAQGQIADAQAALELAPAPSWQPISSAPKDGQTILVCLPRISHLIVRASYSTVHKYWKTDCETDGGITRPTFFHDGDLWMPLPAPPTGDA